MKYNNLFSPINLAGQEIKNRIFMAPMGTGFEEYYYGGRVSTEMIDYYEARARGGTGLIISPFASVDERYFALTMGIYSRKLLMGISRLAETLHIYDCKFLVQLSHFGGKSPRYFVHGNTPIAPSSIDSVMYPEKPLEMTLEQIEEIIGLYIQSGEWARDAGCDGVELHGAHGYLINQFYSPHTNKRNDEYGGTLEKRLHFLVKIAEVIRKKCGKDFIIGFKFSAHEHLDGGIDINEAKKICGYLDGLELLDYIHVSANAVTIPIFLDCSYPEVPPIYNGQPLVPLAAEIKKNVKTPVIATSGISDPELAEEIIKDKKADIVAIGRALIADPEWANKAKSTQNIKPCIKCNTCYKKVLNQQVIKCSVNPYVGEERKYGELINKKADKTKKVLIIGSGPAGLEAGITAKLRGHDVIIYEKENEIGGNLRFASRQDFKKEIRDLLHYYKDELMRNNIEVKLNKELNLKEALAEKPDVVIVAIGSTPIIPDFIARNNFKVFFAEDILKHASGDISGKKIAVIGAGLIGCEIALHLALKKKKIFLIDCLSFDNILIDEAPVNKHMLITKLRKEGVEILCEKEIEILDDGKTIIIKNEKDKKSFSVDNLVIATGYKPLQEEAVEISQKLKENVPHLDIHIIGDCKKVGKIFDAINKGAQTAWFI